jgi:putative ATP-dependent endonuclease of the OLD family
MFLERLKLQRFRSCSDTTVRLRPELTVLVGENNGGKSNVIDAMRLLTLPLNGRRDRYAEDDDVRRGVAERTFAIEGRFTARLAAKVDDAPDIDDLRFPFLVETPGLRNG